MVQVQASDSCSAKMSAEVYTVERIEELMEKAKKRLDELKFSNIYYKVGTEVGMAGICTL